MLKSPKKYIITGPPGSGKSTLIHALQQLGIPCIEEVSRDIIIKEQNQGLDGMPWRNIQRFTQLVIQETQHRLFKYPESLFTDRSLIDNIAYNTYYKARINSDLLGFNFEYYYHNLVFFAPLWPDIYRQDPQRPQEFNEQVALSETLKETYINHGFTIEDIPCVTVEERVLYILNRIKELNPNRSDFSSTTLGV